MIDFDVQRFSPQPFADIITKVFLQPVLRPHWLRALPANMMKVKDWIALNAEVAMMKQVGKLETRKDWRSLTPTKTALTFNRASEFERTLVKEMLADKRICRKSISKLNVTWHWHYLPAKRQTLMRLLDCAFDEFSAVAKHPDLIDVNNKLNWWEQLLVISIED